MAHCAPTSFGAQAAVVRQFDYEDTSVGRAMLPADATVMAAARIYSPGSPLRVPGAVERGRVTERRAVR